MGVTTKIAVFPALDLDFSGFLHILLIPTRSWSSYHKRFCLVNICSCSPDCFDYPYYHSYMMDAYQNLISSDKMPWGMQGNRSVWLLPWQKYDTQNRLENQDFRIQCFEFAWKKEVRHMHGFYSFIVAADEFIRSQNILGVVVRISRSRSYSRRCVFSDNHFENGRFSAAAHAGENPHKGCIRECHDLVHINGSVNHRDYLRLWTVYRNSM